MRRRVSIKGTKGTGSETERHNAVSVNYDARIKETVTPGERKRQEIRRRSERSGRGAEGGSGPKRKEDEDVERERERDESLGVSQL